MNIVGVRFDSFMPILLPDMIDLKCKRGCIWWCSPFCLGIKRFMPFMFIVRRQECDFIACASHGAGVCIRRTAP